MADLFDVLFRKRERERRENFSARKWSKTEELIIKQSFPPSRSFSSLAASLVRLEDYIWSSMRLEKLDLLSDLYNWLVWSIRDVNFKLVFAPNTRIRTLQLSPLIFILFYPSCLLWPKFQAENVSCTHAKSFILLFFLKWLSSTINKSSWKEGKMFLKIPHDFQLQRDDDDGKKSRD